VNSRRDVVLVSLLVGLVLVMAVFTGSGNQGGDSDPRPSTYLTSPLGAKALLDVMRVLQQPEGRRMEPLADAAPIEGPLVLLAPSLPPSAGEVHALASWIRRGGTLIYAARRDDETLDTLGLALRTFLPDTSFLAERRSEGVPATVEATALGSGIGVVDGFRRGFQPATVSAHHATVLASAREVPVVVDFRLGKGRVIAWSDALPLVNDRLKASRGALLFVRTAADAAGGRKLWFDEFHHGFQNGGSVVGGTVRFLLRPGWGHLLMQISVALLGVLLVFGRRFGSPLQPAPARRRSPLEHVEALAGAYRQAGARDTARRLLLAGLARRLGRRVPRSGEEEREMLQRLSAHPTAGEAAASLEAEWKQGAQANLVTLSRDVDRYLQEINRT
jgi:hypothetical protein